MTICNFEPTDIEKKNLEAHVELCAERYKLLETKLNTLESKISNIADMVESTNNMVQAMADKRNDQIMNWGLGIIAALVSLVAWLAVQYIDKL